MIKSILFDLDGTLCDCTELHYESLNEALHEVCNYKITLEDHLLNYNGLPTKKKLKILNDLNLVNPTLNNEIWNKKQQKTINLINKLLSPEKDKIELLSYLKNKNYKIACVTNSIKDTARLILKTTGQIDFFDLIISNDMINNPKPHPEGWIRAMINFNSYPEETVIVEDSPVGLESAKLSAANIWKITSSKEVNLDGFLKLKIGSND